MRSTPFIKVGHVIILLIGLGITFNSYGQKNKSRLNPFMNYRFSFSAGLGYSPIALTANQKYYTPFLNTFKPNIKTEYAISHKVCVSIGLQREKFNYQYDPKLTIWDMSRNYYKPENLLFGASAEIYSLHFDLRKYSTITGSIAPFGRYMLYGFSMSRFNLYNEKNQLTITDKTNGDLDFLYPAQSFKATTSGFRFGFGKKQYVGKTPKNFLEYQFLFDINLVKPQSLSYKTAMRKSQNTSILQFTVNYGFSL